jgi:hypothetical protein
MVDFSVPVPSSVPFDRPKSACHSTNRFGISRDKLVLSAMVFTKRLREGVRRGFITCSIRIWKHPHVKVGGRYRMDEGEILIESIELISLQDVTHDLAIESGFQSRADLLKVAKHGSGDNVYLVRFRFFPLI